MSLNSETFGQTVRRLREEKGISLRKLAMELGVSPTFLSKMERDEEKLRPSEEKTKRLAQLLNQDEDEFLALSGKVSEDLKEIIRQHPKEIAFFLRTAKDIPPERFESLTQQLQDKPE